MDGQASFRDDGSHLALFADEVLVVCPQCGKRGVVGLRGDPPRPRLTCDSCGCARDAASRREVWGAPVDPWFECDLWLQKPFGSHVVWAYNAQHATVLRDFVVAGRRERAPGNAGAAGMSMIERLPAWFKAADNRDRLARILNELIERGA